MQNGPEHNKIFDWGCILAQNAVKYSLTYTKKLSVSAGAHKPLPLGEVYSCSKFLYGESGVLLQ